MEDLKVEFKRVTMYLESPKIYITYSIMYICIYSIQYNVYIVYIRFTAGKKSDWLIWEDTPICF